MESLKKKLAILRYITPDRAFMARSKEIILSEKQAFSLQFFFKSIGTPRLVTLGACVALLLIVAFPNFGIHNSPSLTSLKDADTLSKEAEMLPISIELQEVSYRNGKNEIITAAITEIRDTNVRHLKEEIIESETPTQESPSADRNQEINKLLESVTL
jgi:hypothetical protein